MVGLDPLHFNGVVVPGTDDAQTCAEPILQYAWQDASRTSREDIAEMIRQVEDDFEDYLNYYLTPTYVNGDVVPYPMPSNPDLFHATLYNFRGTIRAVKVGPKSGYLVGGGRESKVFISTPVVGYSDMDGDGYLETATVTAGVGTIIDVTQIAVYYPGHAADDTFEIRPITVSIVSGTATITFRREQCVNENLLFGLDATGVDGTNNANFLTHVDVYQHWLDFSQTPVIFRWEQSPWLPGQFAVAFTTQNGAMLVNNSRLGWATMEPAHFDVPSQMYIMDIFNNTIRMPDTFAAWYRAGLPLDVRNNMQSVWEQAISYLTLARLFRPICACDTLRGLNEYWSHDFSQNSPNRTQQISRRKLDCPLGTTRAALHAWERIMRLRLPDMPNQK
jgi:hypothetical protein